MGVGPGTRASAAPPERAFDAWIKGDITLPPGAASPEQVRAGIEARLEDVRRCAEQGALWNGEGQVRLGIGFHGDAFVRSVVPPADASPDATACLKNALTDIQLLPTRAETFVGVMGMSATLTLVARSAPHVARRGPITLEVTGRRMLVTLTIVDAELREGIVLASLYAAVGGATSCNAAAAAAMTTNTLETGLMMTLKTDGSVSVDAILERGPRRPGPPPPEDTLAWCLQPHLESLHLPPVRYAKQFRLRARYEPLTAP